MKVNKNITWMQKFVGKFSKVKIRWNHVIESIISSCTTKTLVLPNLWDHCQDKAVRFILFLSVFFYLGPAFLSIRLATYLANSLSLHFYLNSLSFTKNPFFTRLLSQIIQILAWLPLDFFVDQSTKTEVAS